MVKETKKRDDDMNRPGRGTRLVNAIKPRDHKAWVFTDAPDTASAFTDVDKKKAAMPMDSTALGHFERAAAVTAMRHGVSSDKLVRVGKKTNVPVEFVRMFEDTRIRLATSERLRRSPGTHELLERAEEEAKDIMNSDESRISFENYTRRCRSTDEADPPPTLEEHRELMHELLRYASVDKDPKSAAQTLWALKNFAPAYGAAGAIMEYASWAHLSATGKIAKGSYQLPMLRAWHKVREIFKKEAQKQALAGALNNVPSSSSPNDELEMLNKIKQQVAAEMKEQEKGKPTPVGVSPVHYKRRWGNIEVHELVMNRTAKRKRASGSMPRGAEEGDIFRYPHRWCSDRAVFGRKKRVPGGTVLVDVSGSMSLLPWQVEQIIMHAPAVCVAVFDSHYFQRPVFPTSKGFVLAKREITGAVRVIANGGRFHDPSLVVWPASVHMGLRVDSHGYDHWGGNSGDFLALQWLVKQKPPFVWVTDLGIGYVDAPPGAIGAVAECVAFCRRHKIKVVPNTEAALELFEKMEKV